MSVLASTAPLVYSLAGVLVLLAIVLIIVGVRLLRTSTRDHAALGPLEALGGRRYEKAGTSDRMATLSAARPAGAKPLADVPPSTDAA